MIRPFSDSVDRISTIQSYRLALLENDTKLLLAVSFDQPWEPYIRRIWRDTGPFLDVVLCNCVDYEQYASDMGFEAVARWVRKVQVDADFFYVADELSVEDRRYLSTLERRVREGPPATADQDTTRITVPNVVDAADAQAKANPTETVLTGLRALGVLYRLRDYHRPAEGRRDHIFYHLAVRRLLYGFNERTQQLPPMMRDQFKRELEWFEQVIVPPDPPDHREPPQRGEIQGGIRKSYKRITHGCLLLLQVTDRDQAAQFLRGVPITTDAEAGSSGPFYNVALTYEGLERLGVDEESLAAFPQEFRVGMEARAGLLGDVRGNHPSQWNLPRRVESLDGTADWPRVRLSSVDVVVQLRCSDPESAIVSWGQKHPLYGTVQDLLRSRTAAGVQLLAVEPMNHFRDRKDRDGTNRDGKDQVRGHFGFIDGISQPNIKDDGSAPSPDRWTNDASLGDLLVGYGNSYGDPPYEPDRVGSLLDKSTFLVVRKLRQDVAALREILPADADEQEHVLGKMMGRSRNGTPLAAAKGDNDFDFAGDADGDVCPVHAHIRRANPRAVTPVQADDRPGVVPVPRIVRRGMSYGPRVIDTNVGADRGLMFMAYNASIAEQFEVIQRWVSGGNASGGFSCPGDPFLAVPVPGQQGVLRYLDGEVKRQPLDRADGARPLVGLEWGMYLFVPSMATLTAITGPQRRSGRVDRGQQLIDRIRRAEAEETLGPSGEAHRVPACTQWKALLEDLHPSQEEDLDAVWEAIRVEHGGVLRTPYGVLVGSERLVREVLADDGTRFSIREYWWRLKNSFGDIYLSMDRHPSPIQGGDPSQPDGESPYEEQVGDGDYERFSKDVNDLLATFDEKWAFRRAHEVAQAYLEKIPTGVQGNLRVRHLADVVLGRLAADWFGIPDGTFIKEAGEPGLDDDLHCPYHFVASSRYAFSPNPGPAVEAEGRKHGSDLKKATKKWLETGATNTTPIGGKMLKMLRLTGSDLDRLSSEIIGVMHGFLPSTLGNFLKAMNTWLEDETLWRLQQDYVGHSSRDSYRKAIDTLRVPAMKAMQYRPVPDQIHRTVVRDDLDLGGEQLHPGDRLVVGLGSASAELLEQGATDVKWVFGGERSGADYGSHACPARKIGLGTLLGMVAAVLEVGDLRPEPAPLVLTITGPGFTIRSKK